MTLGKGFSWCKKGCGKTVSYTGQTSPRSIAVRNRKGVYACSWCKLTGLKKDIILGEKET